MERCRAAFVAALSAGVMLAVVGCGGTTGAGGTSTVRGTVTPAGEGLAVALMDDGTFVAGALCDASGFYRITQVPAGTYRVVVAAADAEPATVVASLVVPDGETVQEDLTRPTTTHPLQAEVAISMPGAVGATASRTGVAIGTGAARFDVTATNLSDAVVLEFTAGYPASGSGSEPVESPTVIEVRTTSLSYLYGLADLDYGADVADPINPGDTGITFTMHVPRSRLAYTLLIRWWGAYS